MICGGGTPEKVWLGGAPTLEPASGYAGQPDATSGGRAIAGCSNPGEHRTPHQPVCSAERLRRVKLGFAGPLARRITYGNDRLHFT
ncbi:MAG: hypothetical protein AAGC46_08920, partial [Solirubrobacteraceae bacterium]